MDISGLPDNSIRIAVSSGFANISMIWTNLHTVLAKTEVYDAELTLQVIEAYREFEVKAEKLLRDNLYKQGFTDEQIDARAAEIKKMLGFE